MASEKRITLEGLSEEQAAALLRSDGPNELPRPGQRTALRIFLEVMREPMLALLLGSGAVYLLLGELQDALILLAFAMMSIVITVVQEARTERVLEALRDLTSPRATVTRDGERRRIPGREVVCGDLLLLAEGDRVPADAIMREGHDLQIDESLLTGESVPVHKVPATEGIHQAMGKPGGDGQPFVFSGTLVVRGQAQCRVLATGIRSEIGKIGHSLSKLETEPPRLQAQTRRLVKIFALAGGLVSLGAVLLYVTLRGGWLDGLLAGIALGMSMLPEEFPVVLVVFMAMGAWRISKVRVLTRRASAIETLGSATVLCTDKTGTLTENRMAIAELRLAGFKSRWRQNEAVALPKAFAELAETGLLASATQPTDPMDKAFHDLWRQRGPQAAQWPTDELNLLRAYGLRPELLAVTQVWQGGRGAKIIAAKGAPEAIAALCKCDGKTKAAITAAVNEMAASGLRVLGVARASHAGKSLPETQRAFAFTFLGLVGLADPLRASVPAAVAQCRSAGIRVVMITGDYPATASAIAAQAGLNASHVAAGAELESLDDQALAELAGKAAVFARVMPDQKLRIVNVLKVNGEIVAMTGDGVNDAPSLKAAHIGIAMGGRGTDVAREASSIVLLDDDFGSIVQAIRQGRRIYDNLRKAMSFIFAVHVPIAGLALLPLVMGLPILLGPIHIAILEMVIDPVCSLVFEAEPEESDVMSRPPRPPAEPLFSRHMIFWSLLQGAVALAFVAGIYLLALSQGLPVEDVRALAFFSLIMAVLALIFVNRTFSASLATALGRNNTALVGVLAALFAFMASTLLWPFARNLLHFGPLHGDDLAISVATGAVVLASLQLAKLPLAKWLKS
ncbi:MAG: cation-translocating P-type ATPase [Alphaproteobacteria bacterium]|nr:cation-translocating P-type ATPase [Alphaproteobacteria bacterium]